MRYYAGNWAYNEWLFQKNGCREKLQKLKKYGNTTHEQLENMIEDETELAYAKSMMGVMRWVHLQGRPLLEALPAAVDDIEDYEMHSGELIGGAILGWNFGDGHLNGWQLLRAIQPICGFESGELRMISVESQPMMKSTMHWQVYDAADGLIAEGVTDLNEYLEHPPWPVGEVAAALSGGRSSESAG